MLPLLDDGMFVLSPQSALHDRSPTPDHTMEHEYVLEAVRQRLDMNPQAMRVLCETA